MLLLALHLVGLQVVLGRTSLALRNSLSVLTIELLLVTFIYIVIKNYQSIVCAFKSHRLQLFFYLSSYNLAFYLLKRIHGAYFLYN